MYTISLEYPQVGAQGKSEIIDSPTHKSSREGSPSSSGKSLTDPLLSETEDHEMGLGHGFESKPHQVIPLHLLHKVIF